MYTVRGVRGLGIRMLTLDTRTSLHAEDRGFQVPMTLEHGKIGGTQFCDQSPESEKTRTHPAQAFAQLFGPFSYKYWV